MLKKISLAALILFSSNCFADNLAQPVVTSKIDLSSQNFNAAAILNRVKNAFVGGTNPVTVVTTPSTGLPSTTSIGSSYSVEYTLTNNLPSSRPMAFTVSSVTTAPGFTVENHCGSVAYKNSCTIDVSFVPQKSGPAAYTLTYQYGDFNQYQLKQSTTVQTSATAEIQGAVTKSLPVSTTVGDTSYPVEFTFNNIGQTNVTASSVVLTGDTADFTQTSNNCTQELTPGSSPCHIIGTFTPSTAGHLTLGATYNYSGKSVSVETHTIAFPNGSCISVTGVSGLPLPTNTYQYGDNVIRFTFTNNCNSDSATLGIVTINVTVTPSSSSNATNDAPDKKLMATNVNSWLTQGENTCTGTLAAQHSCDVYASVVPQSTGSNLVVSASLPYTQSGQSKTATSSTTASTILSNNSTNRMITVVNQCPGNVWMTFLAGATSTPAGCANGSQTCPTGSTCNSTAAGGQGLCYFNNPSLDGRHTAGEMTAQLKGQAPDTMSISIPESGAISGVVYNGGVAMRLGCTEQTPGDPSSLVCTSNNCGSTVNPASGSTGSDGMCTPGTGVSSYPAMSFNAMEFTFLQSGNQDGVYDHQTINGVNVPMEMKGRGPATVSTIDTEPYANCQATGAIIQPTTGDATTQLGACNYNYSTPSPSSTYDPANYILVTPVGNTTCSESSPCSGGLTCGLAADPNSSPTAYYLNKMCGNFQGYVSVNTAICSQSNFVGSLGTTLQTLYQCGSISGSPSTGAELYACAGSYAGTSCYTGTGGTETTCCGCVNWWDSDGGNLTVPNGSSSSTVVPTKSCGAFVNPHWVDTVLPQVKWVKAACPTAYAYQYDDESSSFHCTVKNTSNQIVTNYQITLCPGDSHLANMTE